MSWTLRIMGSQNWWFGDPRALLYRVKPLYRRVQWFLGKEGSSSFRMLRRNTSYVLFLKFGRALSCFSFIGMVGFCMFSRHIEGWNDTQCVPPPTTGLGIWRTPIEKSSGGSHSEKSGVVMFFCDERITSRWWFQKVFIFNLTLGDDSILTNIFQKGLKPPTRS